MISFVDNEERWEFCAKTRGTQDFDGCEATEDQYLNHFKAGGDQHASFAEAGGDQCRHYCRAGGNQDFSHCEANNQYFTGCKARGEQYIAFMHGCDEKNNEFIDKLSKQNSQLTLNMLIEMAKFAPEDEVQKILSNNK